MRDEARDRLLDDLLERFMIKSCKVLSIDLLRASRFGFVLDPRWSPPGGIGKKRGGYISLPFNNCPCAKSR